MDEHPFLCCVGWMSYKNSYVCMYVCNVRTNLKVNDFAVKKKIFVGLMRKLTVKLTTRKWAALAECSQDTALRGMTELLACGVLQKSPAGGPSTSYELLGFCCSSL